MCKNNSQTVDPIKQSLINSYELFKTYQNIKIKQKNKQTNKCMIRLRALASGNFNSILFYHSKKLLYHYNIPFYNTSTSQTFISLFYTLK